MLKGQSPSPAPWWDLCCHCDTFGPTQQDQGTQRRGELQGEVLPWTHRILEGDLGVHWYFFFIPELVLPTQDQLVL